MEIIFYRLLVLAIFFFGLAVGSFLNCVIYRLEAEKSFLKGRSFCPYCRRQLQWYDLIPVFSYLFLRGRCRYCGKKISIQYPLVEMSAGIVFLLIFRFYQPFSLLNLISAQALSYLFLVLIFSLLIIIFVYDLKHYIIPDKIIYPAIAVVALFNLQFVAADNFSLFSLRGLFFKSLLAGAVGAAFFFALWFFSRGRWMGFGDVKLAFLIGFFLGPFKSFIALFLAFFIGAVVGVVLIAAKRKTLKSQVPFGPFLVIGTFIALLWGEPLSALFLKLVSI
ncbi:MAG TPA: prepilin peptidase [Candidatus Parcubacteria bacterium]|nr:prepilin peptidase [Candidatus Parcubacteria bacterium]